VSSVYLGHLGIRHATKDASTKASAGTPPAIAGLMRRPVLYLGRSSPGLRFASQSQKSCRTTPPAWSARRNTCQSRSASLDIRYLPCLLIWHFRALIARTVLSASFDYLVGAGEEYGREGEAERLRGLQIDGEAKKCRLLERQFGRLCAFENAVNQGGHPREAFV
jgi:hypothetical protein